MSVFPLLYDPQSGDFYCGPVLLSDLTPLDRVVLHFLMANPFVRLSKTCIIENVWPEYVAREGVSDDALYQRIYSVRKKLRQYSDHHYIVSYRDFPEGGYKFIPATDADMPAEETAILDNHLLLVEQLFQLSQTITVYQENLNQLAVQTNKIVDQLQTHAAVTLKKRN